MYSLSAMFSITNWIYDLHLVWGALSAQIGHVAGRCLGDQLTLNTFGLPGTQVLRHMTLVVQNLKTKYILSNPGIGG